MRYTDSIQLPYPGRAVFEMVADIERYPEFLPGWRYARILERQNDRLHVEQQLQAGPATFRFFSTAVLEPFSGIHIRANDGLFRDLRIDWRITPVDADSCRLAVEVELAAKPGLRNSALLVLLKAGSSELLPTFARRAQALYS